MELLAAVVIVVGFLAIVVRFIARDPTGEVRLPRIVDESVGMWALRRATGLSLWQRHEEPDDEGSTSGERPAPFGSLEPTAVSAQRPGAPLLQPSLIGTTRRLPLAPPAPRPPRPQRPRTWSIRAWPWPSPAGPLAAAFVISIVALGAAALPRHASVPRGEVLEITGVPGGSPGADAPGSSTRPPGPSDGRSASPTTKP